MSYIIFNKLGDNVEGSFSRIAENITDLNNFNIIKSDYKIIEISSEDFNLIKLGKKNVVSYNGNTVNYTNETHNWSLNTLKIYVDNCQKEIENFLKQNINHPDKNKWSNYLSQLKNFDLNTLNYPFTKSLEEHFNDIGQNALNINQIP